MNFEFTMNISDYYLMNKLSIGSYINALLAMVLFITFLINYIFVYRTKLMRLLGKFALILFLVTFSFAMFTNGKTIIAISFWQKISLISAYIFFIVTIEITEFLTKKRMKVYKSIMCFFTILLIILLIINKGYVLGSDIIYSTYPQLEHGKFYFFYHAILPLVGVYNYYVFAKEIISNSEFKSKYISVFILYNIIIINAIFSVAFSLTFKVVKNFFWISVMVLIIYFITIVSIKQNKLSRKIEMTLKEKEDLNKRLMKSSLTGVYTRRYFEENYEKYITDLSEKEINENKHWIAFIDIDKFKKINDVYGHTVGDEILKEFGKMLIDKSGEKHLPARFGGDEFIVLLKNSDIDEVNSFFTQLNNDFGRAIEKTLKDENKYGIGLSIGIVNSKDYENDLHEAIMKADTAMYTAKESGGGKFSFYEEKK